MNLGLSLCLSNPMKSSSSSSCHVTKIKYDVFISFRGADVRRGLLSHLVKELRREKIDAYVDYRLERGDEISSLFKAIEGSQVFLVIFSKDYASSKWCLDELVKMMECVEKNKQILIPVFYNIEPSDVGNQRKGYGAALAKHEKKQDMIKVQNWRSALEKAAQFSGLHYPLNFENESDLIDEIVKGVSNQLNKFCSSELDGPSKSNGFVGIDQTFAWIETLLTTETREVLMLGIWGMGGIGKTAIARVAFETLSPQYEGCCFLENVREELEKHQLSYLQEKLVSELLKEENPHINGTGKANSSTKRKLSRMKVLIVLDDVNTPKALKGLLEPNCFGPGSSVIVTSRDLQVFNAGGFHVIHKVKELNFEESLKLFCIKAFNESQPKMGYEELSKKAVAIAKGIPLALVVFGAYFHSKENKDTWECALEKFKNCPNGGIQKVLRLSYDGLDHLEKKVFLDIAFFFKEEDKGYVIRQMDAWDFHGASGIQALQEKALITISNDNRIQMHDLIQEMGWEIVRQENTNLGRRSRLRDADEVFDVLQNNKGTDSVEGMVLDVSEIGEVALNVDSLKRMPNLRLLKLHSPMKISYFLQEFAMLQQFAELLSCNERYGVLISETKDVSGSKQLMPLPNLNIESALKEVMGLGSEVHIKSLHFHFMHGYSVSKNFSVLKKEIRPLNATDTGTETLNSIIRHLGSLEFSDIKGLQPENVGAMELSLLPNEMRRLNLMDTRMELLSSSTRLFSSLDYSEVDDLQHETPPKELPLLTSTSYHRLSNCRGQETRKPKQLVLFDGFVYYSEQWRLKNLVEFALDGSNVDRLAWGFKHLSGLKKLSLRRCIFHRSIPELPPSLEVLLASNCALLETIALGSLERLKILSLIRCRFLRFITDLPPSIEELYTNKCEMLETVALGSNTAVSLGRLKILSLRGCRSLRSIPELPPSVEELYADNCILLETVVLKSNTVRPLERLKILSLVGCRSLRSISELPPSVEKLYADNCKILESRVLKSNTIRLLERLKILPPMGCRSLRSMRKLPPSVEELDADNSIMLETMLLKSNTYRVLERLKILSLSGCRSLQYILELPPLIEELYANNCIMLEMVLLKSNTGGSLEQLKTLSLMSCRRLKRIAKLPPSIEVLYANDCVLLKAITLSSNTAAPLEQLKILSLRGCGSLQSIPKVPARLCSLPAWVRPPSALSVSGRVHPPSARSVPQRIRQPSALNDIAWVRPPSPQNVPAQVHIQSTLPVLAGSRLIPLPNLPAQARARRTDRRVWNLPTS